MINEHYSFQNAQDRITVLIGILSNREASIKQTIDRLPYYYSINRLHRILKIPKIVLRNDMFQIYHYVKRHYPTQALLIPLQDIDMDLLTPGANQLNAQVKLFKEDYPPTNECLYNLVDTLYDVECDEYTNPRTGTSVNADSFVHRNFMSGKYDILPFRLEQSFANDNFLTSLLSEINIYLTYEEHQLLDDFLFMHNLGSLNHTNESYLQFSKQLFSSPSIANLNQLLSEIQKNIDNQCFVECYYLNSFIRILPVQLVFFPMYHQYYLVGLSRSEPVFLELCNLKIPKKSKYYFKSIDENPLDSFQKKTLSKLKHDIPYMWGPTNEKPSHVKIEIFDDNHGQVLKKALLTLGPYTELPGNKLIQNDSWIFEGTIIDLEAFTSWVMGFGASIIVHKPTSLRMRMISLYQNRLSNYSLSN